LPQLGEVLSGATTQGTITDNSNALSTRNTLPDTTAAVDQTGTGSGNETVASKTTQTTTATPPPQERTDASVNTDGQLQLSTVAQGSGNSATEAPKRQALERLDVSVGANGQIKLQQQAPKEGETATGIMLVEVQQQPGRLEIEIADFRRTPVVQYRATLPDGSPLPDWIKVDPATGRVTAEPGNSVRLIQLKFMAQDADGSVRTLEIKLDLSTQNSQMLPALKAVMARDARPAFMQQVALQQQKWDGYGEQLLSVFTEQ